MNQILADLWQRIIKEARVTLAGTGEAVLAISERINRKTQLLRLHWQAAAVADQMEKVSRTVGHALCDLATSTGNPDSTATKIHGAASVRLLEGATAIRSLKQELTQVEGLIRELEVEVLLEDLAKVQRDLTSRSASLSRLIVASNSLAIGLSVAQLNLPMTIHVAALFRGPSLVSPAADVPIRAGDIVILLGPRAELERVALHFLSHTAGVPRRKASNT